jgi:C1A family cysteine protease
LSLNSKIKAVVNSKHKYQKISGFLTGQPIFVPNKLHIFTYLIREHFSKKTLLKKYSKNFLNKKMQSLILVFTLVLIAKIHCDKSSYEKDWLVHKAKYNINFESSEEEQQKLNNFIKNKRLINSHNNAKQARSFTLKENSRIHYSPSEFKEKFLLKFNVSKRVVSQRLRNRLVNQNSLGCSCNQTKTSDVYTNWVERGVVGPVQDQLNCGGCYAFTTVSNYQANFIFAV